MDDVTVDLGEIPLEHARTLLICVGRTVESGSFWDAEHYKRAASLRAMLSYRIAKAEKTATYSEPG